MTVGAFTLTPEGELIGPAEYMAEAFPAFLAKFEAGESAVFTHGAMLGKGSPEQLFLVAVQTHYAGWKGTRSLLRGLR